MKRFKNILCVVEPGEISKPALERAVLLAENNQARLMVIDVIEQVIDDIDMPDGGPISNKLQAAMALDHEQRLKPLLESYRKHIDIEFKIIHGDSFLAIIREVLGNKRDLVIKVPQTPDWLDRVFGSEDMHLLRKCPCPVWLIKPEAPKSYRRILAAVDVDDAYPEAEQKSRQALNHKILEIAGSLALSEFAELHVVHVWDAIGESAMRGGLMRTPEEKILAYVEQVRRHHERSLNALLHELNAQLGPAAMSYLSAQKHLIKGWARKEIPALAKQIDADLIVMGTVARTGIPGFIMGNTAETILNQIECSVLAIKPPGFTSPVKSED